MDSALATEAAELYALPPGEFTGARNARAKALRRDEPELAAAVAKLPKPTVAAAAVNRLARDQPSEVRELVQAGKRLREAQERSVAGAGGVEELQRAVAQHRAALERLQREARRLGLSEPVLERVGRTIRAASVEPELQRLLERGLLAEEVESTGFGLDPGLVVLARPNRAPPTARDESAKRRQAEERLAQAEEVLRAAEAEVRQADDELRRAEKAAADARRKAERAEAQVVRARKAL